MSDDEACKSGSAIQPLDVIYCGVCSMPLEYCEFDKRIEQCKEWIANKHPDLFDELFPGNEDAPKKPSAPSDREKRYQAACATLPEKAHKWLKKPKGAGGDDSDDDDDDDDTDDSEDSDKGNDDSDGSDDDDDSDDEPKKAPAAAKKAAAAPAAAQPPQKFISVEVNVRSKNKMATIIRGLGALRINNEAVRLTEAAKIFQNKLATGVSASKNTDEVVIQGDRAEDAFEVLRGHYRIPQRLLKDLGIKGKRPTKKGEAEKGDDDDDDDDE